MKKLILFILICSNIFGATGTLNGVPGLTFLKNYAVNQSSLNADFSAGTGTATFARGSGTTVYSYVNASGVVCYGSSADIPRYQGGYYDATGFHQLPGLMIETGTIANNVPSSVSISNAYWAISNTTDLTANDTDNGSTAPDGTATCPSLTAAQANGTLLLTTSVTGATYSVWLKRKTGTGTINITANGGSNWTACTLSTSWRRFNVYAASASQKCGIQIVTQNDAIYCWGHQFTSDMSMTSYVPTTTSAKNRYAEHLKYPIANNRTAATETIIIKFAPFHDFSTASAPRRYLISSDTKDRAIFKEDSGLVLLHYANKTDNSGVKTSGTTNCVSNTSYTVAATFKHASPYVRSFLNGTYEAQYTTGDFTDPAWGTYFYIGERNDASQAFGGVIQAVAIFNSVLTDDQIATVSAGNFLMNSNPLMISGD